MAEIQRSATSLVYFFIRSGPGRSLKKALPHFSKQSDLERKKAEQKRKSSRTKSSNVDEDKDEVSAAEEDDIEEADEDEEVESGSGKLV